MIKSAYIHIPFCKTICSYCDFCKVYYQKNVVFPYLKNLEKEIKEKYKGETLSTLYIGGGTPSSLPVLELQKLFEILSFFKLEKNAEITFECNIENIDEEKLKILKEKGVNRLSVGVQTFQTKYLKYLKRNHTKEEVYQKIDLIKKIGFQNINVDMMYGFDLETLEEVEDDLHDFLKLKVPHLSIYSLIIEPHTSLFIEKKEGVDEELEAKMYDKIKNILKKEGYEHYEVSNFAKKGYESLHNLTYWNNEEYYGFGLGATAYVSPFRFENTRSFSKYNKGIYHYRKENVTPIQKLENEFILGFRKIKGISKEKFMQKYHYDIKKNKTVIKLLQEEKLKENDKYIYINPKYIYVMNEILIEFLDSKEVEYE